MISHPHWFFQAQITNNTPFGNNNVHKIICALLP